jgi:hypothetical protein
MATSSNAQYNLSAYFPLSSYVLDNGEVEECIDFFNPKGSAFVNSLQATDKFEWNKTFRLDVLAQETFGSVSAWWIPLFFSGDQHPDELRTGARVAITVPTKRFESAKSRSPGRGSRVRI